MIVLACVDGGLVCVPVAITVAVLGWVGVRLCRSKDCDHDH